MKPLRKPLFIVPIILVAGCLTGCSTIDFTRYKPESSAGSKPAVIAVMPIVVNNARSAFSCGPAWIVETHTTAQLSVAEAKSVESRMMRSFERSFSGVRLIVPPEVDNAMQKDSIPTLDAAIPRIAERLSADGVLLLRIRNYGSRLGVLHDYGGTPGQAAGESELTLYNRSGTVLWSISAQVLKQNGVSTNPPSFTDFMEYVLDEFQPEIAKMME
jgi:hypothetical protein